MTYLHFILGGINKFFKFIYFILYIFLKPLINGISISSKNKKCSLLIELFLRAQTKNQNTIIFL